LFLRRPGLHEVREQRGDVFVDIITIGFLAGTFALVASGIIIGGSPEAFINFPSFLIAIGGACGAVAAASSKEELRKLPRTLKRAFAKAEHTDLVGVMEVMVNLSRKSRSEGLLALEEEVRKIENDFVRKSTQLVIDGTSPELVKSILDAEIDLLERREMASKRTFDLLGELAPAFGMLGTLIGLIQMLRHLDTPEALGPGMAIALITTFYGSFVANAFAIPVSRKLARQTADKVTAMELIVEGVLSIQAGENPRLVEEKLKVFLPPEERERLRERTNRQHRTATETAGEAPGTGS
jgi:chemotaxis protein MotA